VNFWETWWYSLSAALPVIGGIAGFLLGLAFLIVISVAASTAKRIWLRVVGWLFVVIYFILFLNTYVTIAMIAKI
jgi:hypothetical protein